MALPEGRLIVPDMKIGTASASVSKCKGYKIVRPIGTWGEGSRCAVYEAEIVANAPPPPKGRRRNQGHRNKDDDLEHVHLILVDNNDEVNYESALLDIERQDSILAMRPKSPNILKCQEHFISKSFMVILLPDKVHSLRSLMSTRPGLKEGIPLQLISEVLRQVVASLHLLHKGGQYHRQISAGNIFYSPQLRQFQLAYGICVYDCRDPPGTDENDTRRCPIKSLMEWAIAPEEDQSWLLPSSKFKYTPHREGSDIWMLGIAALELAYGKIKVADRNQLLNIAAYICEKRTLPNTWKELRAKAESAAGASSAAASKYKNNRFSKSFGRFVARCLDEDATKRYSAQKLLEYGFLKKYGSSHDEIVVALLGTGDGRSC